MRQIGDGIAYVVDNNSALHGQDFCGLPVRGPQALSEERDAPPLVVICTSAVQQVMSQLQALGYEPVQDVVVSPSFLDLRVVEELEDSTVELLFASGTPVVDSARWGGGIYRLRKVGDEVDYAKSYSGFCYGILPVNDAFYTVDHQRGLVRLDGELLTVAVGALPEGSRGHGVGWWERGGRILVAATYLDRILLFDQNLHCAEAIEISERHAELGVPCHHINDILVQGDTLYVSMFSLSGNWHEHRFDGAIVAFDLRHPSAFEVVADDLWMPHNLLAVNNHIYFLDSLRGSLCAVGQDGPIGRFPGYSRGLGWDGRFFYVGQSRHRHHRRIRDHCLNISLDVSVIAFDPATRTSKSMSLPSRLSEIHAIVPMSPGGGPLAP